MFLRKSQGNYNESKRTHCTGIENYAYYVQKHPREQNMLIYISSMIPK